MLTKEKYIVIENGRVESVTSKRPDIYYNHNRANLLNDLRGEHTQYITHILSNTNCVWLTDTLGHEYLAEIELIHWLHGRFYIMWRGLLTPVCRVQHNKWYIG